jgi:hypothetical protein
MPNDGTSYARPDADGDSHAAPNREQARQGQNIRGMLGVLVIGIVAVAIAFAVMVGLSGGAEQSDPSPQADIVTESGSDMSNPSVMNAPPPPSDTAEERAGTPQRTDRDVSAETLPNQ